MQIKLSNVANWNDMISTFKFESETEIYELHDVKTMIRCEILQMYLILSFHSRTSHDKASVIKVEYEMIYKHHAYVDSDKQ